MNNYFSGSIFKNDSNENKSAKDGIGNPYLVEFERIRVKKGLRKVDICRCANIPKSTFNDIMTHIDDNKYVVTKDMSIKFAFGLELSLNETKSLVSLAGHCLQEKILRDRIIVENIVKFEKERLKGGKNIESLLIRTDSELETKGLSCLDNSKKKEQKNAMVVPIL